MVSVEAFYYLLVRFAGKGEDMRKAWWTTLGSQELGKNYSRQEPLSPPLSRNDHARKRRDFLQSTKCGRRLYVYVRVRVKFIHLVNIASLVYIFPVSFFIR